MTTAERWTLKPDSPHYPEGLECIGLPTIYGYGKIEALAELNRENAIAVLGSRRASAYGREVAYSLGNELSDRTIITGMRLGIEGAAHRGALQAGRASIAVLGCGPDVAYPRSHRLLHEQIAANGCIVSLKPHGEFANAKTDETDARQLLAALMGFGVFVEGTLESNTTKTLESASRWNDTQYGAVPGPVTGPLSTGPNEYLRNYDAHVITCAADVKHAQI